MAHIGRAKKELLIYDPKADDAHVVRALSAQAKKGVDVRIIGAVGGRQINLHARKLVGFRLHTRSIVRDRREVFVGSQSLRKAELDARRGWRDCPRRGVVKGIVKTFEAD
jgi:phosphatidylserine/phosphatidylglycerophosphate/cardiolipin synthase-like enzyme